MKAGLSGWAVVPVMGSGGVLGLSVHRVSSEGLYRPFPQLGEWPFAMVFFVAFALAALFFWLSLSRWGASRSSGRESLIICLPLLLPAVYLFEPGTNLWQGLVLLGTAALSVLLLILIAVARPSDRALAGWCAVGVFFVSFAVYLLTLAPTVTVGDGFELQVVSYLLNVAHPTGYPLYTLLGKLFTFLPVGDPAYRINLMSAVFASLTVALVYRTVVLLTGRPLLALVPALALAFSRTFWSQAVVAEKFSLNAFFVAMLILLMARWATSAPTGRLGKEPRFWQAGSLGAVALAFGLSLAHHRTTLLLVPAALFLLLSYDGVRTLRPRKALAYLGLLLLPQTLYIYLPLRLPMTFGQFVEHATGSRYGPALDIGGLLRNPDRVDIYGRLLLEQFGAVGLALALVGIGWLAVRQRRLLLFLVLGYLSYLLFTLSYRNSYNFQYYLIPTHLILSLWLGAGIVAGVEAAQRLAERVVLWRTTASGPLPSPVTLSQWERAGVKVMGCFVMLLLPAGLLWSNFADSDARSYRGHYDWALRALSGEVERDALILADGEKYAALYYACRVMGVRPDVSVESWPTEADYIRRIDEELARGRAVYLSRPLYTTLKYLLSSVGPLIRIQPVPMGGETAAQHRFGDSLALVEHRVSPVVSPPAFLGVTLLWRAERGIERSYVVSLRLVDESGQVWHEEPGHIPVGGAYPTHHWPVGVPIADYHELGLGQGVPPGRYQLQVGVFDGFAATGLPADGTANDWVALTTVEVAPTQATDSIGYPLRARFGGELMLLGYTWRSNVNPGGGWLLTLFWEALTPIYRGTDYLVELSIVDGAGRTIWQGPRPRLGESPSATGRSGLGGEYPTSRWTPGRVVAETYVLDLPINVEGEMVVRVRDGRTGKTLAGKRAWLRRWADFVKLGPLPVPGQREPAMANFGNALGLSKYQLDRPYLRPGDRFTVLLVWRALWEPGEDYTVFVHLLDWQQRPWAQDDSGPVDGSYPTGLWKEGEVVSDRHTLYLPADAPTGQYFLEVGLYRPWDNQRLPVLDSLLRPVADRILLGPIAVKPRQPLMASDLAIAHLAESSLRPRADRLGDAVELIGYDTAGSTLKPGGELRLTLYWRAKVKPEHDYTVFVHLLSPMGNIAAQQDNQPVSNSYPTSLWDSGELIRDPHIVRLGEEIAPGQYEIRVGMYLLATGERLPVRLGGPVVGGEPGNDSVSLGQITIGE